MRMNALMVALVAALASRAAVAQSDGGDTYSAIQELQRPAETVPPPAPGLARPTPARNAVDYEPEGFETWAHAMAWHALSARETDRETAKRRDDAVTAGATGGSEGGDTFSRFVPEFANRIVRTARVTLEPTT